MNHLDEERLIELAMKTAARQITPAEQSELEALLAREPEARRLFEERLAEARALDEAASLLNATDSRAGELPGYARERLRTKVRQTYGTTKPETQPAAKPWPWRLVMGWASGFAVVALAFLILWPQPAPFIQMAMLDAVGATRGASNEDRAAIEQLWPQQSVSEFRRTEELEDWKIRAMADMKSSAALVIYDRAAGEIQVTGNNRGQSFAKTFVVETSIDSTLKDVKQFIDSQFGP
jgi:hypothetical protein